MIETNHWKTKWAKKKDGSRATSAARRSGLHETYRTAGMSAASASEFASRPGKSEASKKREGDVAGLMAAGDVDR